MTDFFASDPCKQHQNIVHGIERWKVVTHWNMSCSNLGQSKCALFVSLLHMGWVLKAKIEATYVEQSFFYSWNEQQSCDFCWWSFYQVNVLFAVLKQRDWIFSIHWLSFMDSNQYFYSFYWCKMTFTVIKQSLNN